jgi:hypothetical protein
MCCVSFLAIFADFLAIFWRFLAIFSQTQPVTLTSSEAWVALSVSKVSIFKCEAFRQCLFAPTSTI